MIFKGFTANCKEATLLSLKKEEVELSLPAKLKLLLHLVYCASCRRFAKQSVTITQLAANYKHAVAEKPLANLTSEQKCAIQKKINESL